MSSTPHAEIAHDIAMTDTYYMIAVPCAHQYDLKISDLVVARGCMKCGETSIICRLSVKVAFPDAWQVIGERHV